MSSDLQRIITSLGEELRRPMEEPLRVAATGFSWDESRAPTHAAFMELLCSFVARLNHAAPNAALHAKESRYSWALQILDQSYSHGSERGSEAALLGFLSSTHGVVTQIQQCLLIGMLEHERRRQLQLAKVRHLPSDWRSRVDLARKFLSAYEPQLPPHLHGMDPLRLADSIGELLLALVDAQGSLQGMLQRD